MIAILVHLHVHGEVKPLSLDDRVKEWVPALLDPHLGPSLSDKGHAMEVLHAAMLAVILTGLPYQLAGRLAWEVVRVLRSGTHWPLA